MPLPRSPIVFNAKSSWSPQSQRPEPNTSPVRHCEWMRTSGASSSAQVVGVPNERQQAVGLVFGLETEDSKSAESGGKAGFRDLRGFHGRELYHGAAGWLLSSTISSAVPRRPSGPGEISLKAVPLLTW